MTPSSFKAGDRLVHRGKPEWGAGVVVSAAPDASNGRPCQQLSIRFDRVGLKTLSTAYADLDLADGPILAEAAPADSAFVLPGESPEELFVRIPEPAVDPFSSLRSRLACTLGLYRFRPDGASLLDWAAMQTRLRDPLARFSRHELEQHFRRFQNALDEHTRRLLREVRKAEPRLIDELLTDAPPAARQAVRRLDALR